MGVVKNITHNTFPKQSDMVGKIVDICFHYDSSILVPGMVVRDDAEAPWETIFRVGDNYIRATECQYKPLFN